MPASTQTINRSSASGRPFAISFLRFVDLPRQPEARQHVADDRQQRPEQQADRRAEKVDGRARPATPAGRARRSSRRAVGVGPRKPARAIRFWSRDMSFGDFGRNRLARASRGSSSSAASGRLVARTLDRRSPGPAKPLPAPALFDAAPRGSRSRPRTPARRRARRSASMKFEESSSSRPRQYLDVDQFPDDQRPDDLQEQRRRRSC